MANKVDSHGVHFTDSDPHPGSGTPPAGTLVTVYTSNGPVPGYVQNGRAVPAKQGNNGS
jgi:hypothetical protein